MTMAESTEQQLPDENQPLVARAGTYYRNARYIMFVIILAMGAWFLYDGFVTYPNSNKEHDKIQRQIEALLRQPNKDEPTYLKLTEDIKKWPLHEEFSIALQKLLGTMLLPLGICLLGFWLYRSRGEIRLENRILYVPGHPPIPLAKIEEMDKMLWDRKGIAYIGYNVPGHKPAVLRLDDFIYQTDPIREIVRLVEEELQVHLTAAKKTLAIPTPPPPVRAAEQDDDDNDDERDR